MKLNNIKALLEKYFEGQTTLEEEDFLKSFFNSPQVPEEFESYSHHFQFLEKSKSRRTDHIIDDDLLFRNIEKVGDEHVNKPSERSKLVPFQVHSWLKYAAVVTLLFLSFLAGLQLGKNNNSSTNISGRGGENHEAFLVALKNESSASERIMAINESRSLQDNDEEITQALTKAMNYDDNINVRLAALEALSKFTERDDVRKSITKSLEMQDNPLIQIAIIDLLVKIGEKNAINEMQKIIIDEGVQDVVKQRAQVGVALLM